MLDHINVKRYISINIQFIQRYTIIHTNKNTNTQLKCYATTITRTQIDTHIFSKLSVKAIQQNHLET